MRATSNRFLAALRQPHVVRFRVDVIPAAGGPPIALPITGGDLSGDRTSSVRRTCRVTAPADTVPVLEQLPFGSYLDVRRGIRYGDGTEELIRIGLLRIDGTVATTPDGEATLTASDRMAQVADEKLLAPYDANGKHPTDAAVELVQQVFPTIPYTVATSPSTEPALVDVAYDRDRNSAVGELAAAVGAEAYFDADGGFVITPIPDPTLSAPVWQIDVGQNGVLTAHSNALDRAGVYNGVLVRGQADSSTPPITVLVTDDNPLSQTLWGGPFGKVPLILDSQAVQTEEQATAVGQAELARRLGLVRTLNLTVVPNPALEPGDVVDVAFLDGTVERHVLDTVRIPLDVAGAIDLTTRSVYTPPAAPAGVFAGAAAWQELQAA